MMTLSAHTAATIVDDGVMDVYNTRDLNSSAVYYLDDLSPYDDRDSYYVMETSPSNMYQFSRRLMPDHFSRVRHR